MKCFNLTVAEPKYEKTVDYKFQLLKFMVAVYPLLVIPNSFIVPFDGGYEPAGFFCGPRYVILAVVSLVALVLIIKDKPSFKGPAYFYLFLFVVFSLISAILAPVQMTAWIGNFYRWTGVSTYYFCIILFILAKDCRNVDQILNYLIITASIVSFIGLLQYFGINIVPHEPYRDGISYSTIIHPNFFGTYTAFILPTAILIFINTRNIRSLFYASLIYSGLLVSLCRGAWIASFIGFILILIFSFKDSEKRKAFFRLVIAFLLVTMILLPARDGFLTKRIFSLSGEIKNGLNLNEETGNNRIFTWKKTINIYKENWSFGIGPEHLIYKKIVTPAGELIDKAHNIYLEIAVTMGVFSLISYLIFLSYFLRGWSNDKGFLFFVMILVYLIQGFSNIDVIANMPLFWIFLGFSLGYQNIDLSANAKLNY